MPFSLKNIGATYQTLIQKVFKDVLGKTLEAYVNDVLVKSTIFYQYLKDLKKVFNVLRRYNMKLNLKKCVFFLYRC